jgi:hypothetical protein
MSRLTLFLLAIVWFSISLMTLGSSAIVSLGFLIGGWAFFIAGVATAGDKS